MANSSTVESDKYNDHVGLVELAERLLVQMLGVRMLPWAKASVPAVEQADYRGCRGRWYQGCQTVCSLREVTDLMFI